MISHDNCTTAHVQGARIESMVKEIVEEKDKPKDTVQSNKFNIIII
jgi:hypothetical protein